MEVLVLLWVFFGSILGFFGGDFVAKGRKVNTFWGGRNYLLFSFPKLSVSGQKASYTTIQA